MYSSGTYHKKQTSDIIANFRDPMLVKRPSSNKSPEPVLIVLFQPIGKSSPGFAALAFDNSLRFLAEILL